MAPRGRLDNARRPGERQRSSAQAAHDVSDQQVSKSQLSPEGRGGGSPLPLPTSWSRFRPLIPLILGLAFCRAGLIVATYGSYESTDEGVFTDGATLIALAVLGIILLGFAAKKHLRVPKRASNIAVRICILVETLCILALQAMSATGTETFMSRLALSALCTVVASWSMFYWLRRARGIGTVTAAVFVFSALAVSEVELYVTTILPPLPTTIASAALVFSQYALIPWARAVAKPYTITAPTQTSDFFGFAKTVVQSKRLLAATGIGVGFLSIVIGLLRGYPDGLPVPFVGFTRLAYGLLTIAICAALILLVLKGRERVMTVGVFVIMEALACIALMVYAAVPDFLSLGAVFTTTLNAIMVAFTWYVIIAFMSFGKRDPYYYAMGGWIVWLGFRATARMALITAYPLSENDMLINAIMGTLVVVSTQVVLLQFMNIARDAGEEAQSAALGALIAVAGSPRPAGSQMPGMPNAPMPVTATTASMAPFLNMAGMGAPAVGEGASVEASSTGSGRVAQESPAAAAASPANAQATSGSASAPASSDNAQSESRQSSRLMKIMGLDEGDSLADMRLATMQHSAQELGKQFMLSDREVEVLALYALGWTQKRVAEELYISPGTAHAHIKRIYAKTGMHSRQEILDYMQEYTS